MARPQPGGSVPLLELRIPSGGGRREVHTHTLTFEDSFYRDLRISDPEEGISVRSKRNKHITSVHRFIVKKNNNYI